MSLSDQHRQYLRDHAISDEVIDSQGITSEGEHILFPWRDGDNVTVQRKTFEGEGKYLWETGKELHFNVLRDLSSGPVLIQEGTKQSLAALSWAPENFSVIGMPGCYGASKVPLKRFRGREVFICLDADASTNLNVYAAGESLLNRLKKLRVSVKFLQLPVEGTDGMDDFLAELDESERRHAIAFEMAEAIDKVAHSKPTARGGGSGGNPENLPDTKGRVLIRVNEDLNDVVPSILGALKSEWGGTKLFNYGKAITAIQGNETKPLDDGPFIRMVSEVCALYTFAEGTGSKPDVYKAGGRMDSHTIKAVMASAEEFPELKRIVRVPFIRDDGSVCSAPGYDEKTKTMLVPDDCVRHLAVTEAPTKEAARKAASLVLDEWLGDIPFKEGSSRANALALILTPFIRGLVGLAPLAVVDGLQMGVGKNLFADCLAILSTGETSIPMTYTRDDDETRKQITATFRAGHELFVFDEAHVIEGKELARAITAHTWRDRILGVSNMAEFPNQITWMSLGNQVQVNGDCSRRVYWISLSPKGANPQDRDSDSFRHPDLKGWTKEHRGELVHAVLTMIRAWFSAGRPTTSRGKSMGSFEAWDKLVGGIIGYAGVEGFLSELQEKRSETDFENSYWQSHIRWLRETFEGEFTTGMVVSKALAKPKEFEAPPHMEDPSEKGYSRILGQRYSRVQDRWYEGAKLVKMGKGHGNTIKWAIWTPESGGMGVTGVTSTPTRMEKEVSDTTCVISIEGGWEVTSVTPFPPTAPRLAAAHAGGNAEDCSACDGTNPPYPFLCPAPEPVLIGFDLETRSAEELWGPADPSFIRIAGEAYDDADN